MRAVRSILAVAVLVLALSGCSSSSPPDDGAPILTTEVEPRPGDTSSTVTSGLWPALALNDLLFDLVWYSDTIVIASVAEILPAEWGAPGLGDQKTIHQDVILEVGRVLYGRPDPGRIAVRVEGGRIGNVTMMVGNEPVFTVGERSLLFLIRQTVPTESVAAGIDDRDYYRVGYSEWGKCRFKDDETVYLRQDEGTLATIEEKIAELRGAE